MNRIYVALDLETTGLDPQRDAIIEIGAVKFRGREVISTWSSLVNPQRRIPYKIQQLTGITQDDVENAPKLSSLRRPLEDFVQGHPVVGHNIRFDLGFLRRVGLLLQNLGVDTFELARILLPQIPRYSLGALAEALGLSLPNAHRALDDAVAAKDLFLALRDYALQIDLDVLRRINRLAAKSDWSLRTFFLDIERERTRTAFVSGSIRQQLVRKGRLSDAAMGLVLGRGEAAKRLEPEPVPQPLDEEELVAMLSPNGLIARKFPGYEYRAEQIQMLREVVRAFNDGEHLLVEAGTGTGKSLAYLLPAIYFATRNARHVVISTNTINLQDQLFNKDIPDLQRILPLEFKAVLLKGRSNYLCLRRFGAFHHAPNLTTDEVRLLAKILVWLPQTSTGDRAELSLMQEEQRLWSKVCAERETCLGDRCKHRQRGECFLYHARGEAESAHLIIVNHALLLSDLATENRVLPEYDHLVVDEAHHLEARATEQFGFSIDQGTFRTLFVSLSQPLGDGRYSGLLTEIETFLHIARVSQASLERVNRILSRTRDRIERAHGALDGLFSVLHRFVEEWCRNSSSNRGNGYDIRLRITSALRIQPDWSNIEIAWDDLATTLRKIEGGLERLYRGFQGLEEYELEGYDETMQEISAGLERLREVLACGQEIFFEPRDNGIYWASISQRTGALALHMAPLHVGSLLHRNLFAEKETVILTSATLCSDEGFRYIRERLGLEDVREVAVGSPFDYRRSTLLYLPTDIPEPNQPYYQKTVERTIIELCKATQGRTLLLFTSYSQLYSTYRAVGRALEEEKIIIYAQGIDGSRRQLLENFKTTPRAVLAGTRSFWEGIDVVGPALSCLVIVRLPFSVPSDPVFAARSETFDDSFRQYSVPEAVLRFRQGFGRLIRSREDRGVVVVLDARVTTKYYGNAFIQALPECTVYRGSIKELPAIAARWIAHDDYLRDDKLES